MKALPLCLYVLRFYVASPSRGGFRWGWIREAGISPILTPALSLKEGEHHFVAIKSISTSTSFGSLETSTVALAGGSAGKYPP